MTDCDTTLITSPYVTAEERMQIEHSINEGIPIIFFFHCTSSHLNVMNKLLSFNKPGNNISATLVPGLCAARVRHCKMWSSNAT